MNAVNRGKGATASEHILARIAEKSFLDLWTYPNLFRSQKKREKGDGKELCDLLVVCGDDVLIFSDKVIKWSEDKTTEVAWCRWYRKAIDDSIKQIKGAERWLRQFPDRIFLDSACKNPFPIDLPPLDRRRVHGIAIVDGASEACFKETGNPFGRLFLDGSIKGQRHCNKESSEFNPFCIGDVDPDGSFVHVFDHHAILTVLSLFDTVVDFTQYLCARAEFIRSGNLYGACGENDIAAFYLADIDEDGHHTFYRKGHFGPIAVINGYFREFVGSPEFLEKRRSDEVSYIWDSLIKEFTKNIIGGTSEVVFGDRPSVREHEEGIRAMALTNRLYRRAIGARIKEALHMSSGKDEFKMARVFIPENHGYVKRFGFILVVLSLPEEICYSEYRKFRVSLIQIYCKAILVHNPNLDMVVGIGLDSINPSRSGKSEDCVTAFQQEWSEEDVRETINEQIFFNVFPDYRGENKRMTVYEYPHEEQVAESRQVRRQRERQGKKFKK